MDNHNSKVYIFFCSNGLYKDQLADICSGTSGITIKTISLPCSGKIDVPYLIKAFETGADGAVIVACNKRDCRNLEGSKRAQKRAEAVESLLEEIGLSKGRMAVIELKEDMQQALNEIKEFFGRIRSLPESCSFSDTVKGQEVTNL